MQMSEQYQDEEKILASMVKSRECCRQAGKALAVARAAAEQSGEAGGNVEQMAVADRAITQMLSHLQKVPLKMADAMGSNESKEYAARLLLEISELLEKAMIMERETRDIIGSVPAPAAAQRTRRAARAYSKAETV